MFFQKNSRFLFSSLKNFQYYSPSNVSPSVLLTCEHASNELPEGYNWSKNDKKFENTHWSYDIG